MNASWILIGVVAFAMFLQGEAITCWTCGSATTKECSDEPDTSKMTELTDCQYCVKEKSTNTYGFHSVDRFCYTSDEVAAMGETEIKMGCTTCSECSGENSKCLCDGDKCNSAAFTSISLVTMSLSLAIFKLFK